MAELIIYTGRFDPEFLSRAHTTEGNSGASQPAGTTPEQAKLKKAAATAKLQYRKACFLRRALMQGRVQLHDLDWWQQQSLTELEDGTLRRRSNEAVRAFGHGMLRRDDDECLEIGGSTGGVTRFLLDGRTEPDVDAFLAGH